MLKQAMSLIPSSHLSALKRNYDIIKILRKCFRPDPLHPHGCSYFADVPLENLTMYFIHFNVNAVMNFLGEEKTLKNY